MLRRYCVNWPRGGRAAYLRHGRLLGPGERTLNHQNRNRSAEKLKASARPTPRCELNTPSARRCNGDSASSARTQNGTVAEIMVSLPLVSHTLWMFRIGPGHSPWPRRFDRCTWCWLPRCRRRSPALCRRLWLCSCAGWPESRQPRSAVTRCGSARRRLESPGRKSWSARGARKQIGFCRERILAAAFAAASKP